MSLTPSPDDDPLEGEDAVPLESRFGPEDRALLETTATTLYQDAVDQSGLLATDRRLGPESKDRPGFDLLVELGLLSWDATSERYVAKDPAGTQAQVVAPLGQRGAELISESSRWASAFGVLGAAWRRSPISAHGQFTEVRGNANINRFLASVVEDAKTELLTAQPQAGRTTPQLMQALERDTRALERGVSLRTLYQHSARRSSATHKYVRAVTQKGAEVRTLDEFFNRMIVVDRELAVIPGAEGIGMAVAIREPNVVAYLVDIFERSWDRARPFGTRGVAIKRDIAEEQRAMTIRMLIEGHADPASAKRLGISPRTYAGYIADLKEEYDADTRFQLGYLMGQAGVTGQDGDKRRRRRRL